MNSNERAMKVDQMVFRWAKKLTPEQALAVAVDAYRRALLAEENEGLFNLLYQFAMED